MPIVGMPDGTQVQFPDDMPAEQIKGLISQKFPRETSVTAPRPAGGLPSWMETAHSYLDPMRVLAGKAGQKAELQPADFLAGLSMALPAGRVPGTFVPGAATEAASRLGVEVPQGAMRSRPVQSVTAKLSGTPFVGTPVEEALLRANTQLGQAAEKTAQGFGGLSQETAGARARDSISHYMNNVTRANQEKLYNDVETLIPRGSRVPLSNTSNAINQIAAERANAALPESQGVKSVLDATTRPTGMDYAGIKKLRTNLGEATSFGTESLFKDMTNSERKLIYGALSKDLEQAVAAGGPRAQAAFKKANQYTIDVEGQRKNLYRIVGAQRDEDVVNRLQSAASSSSRADLNILRQARAASSPDAWEGVSSSVVSRLGRDAEGNFSPDRFLTAWGKLSPQGKALLFNSTGKPNLAKSLDDIALVSSKLKQTGQYANKSGTAYTTALYGMGAAAAGGATGLATGDYTKGALTALTTILGGRAVAHILARPATARAAANWIRGGGIKAAPVLAKALATAVAAEFNTPNMASRIEQELSTAPKE